MRTEFVIEPEFAVGAIEEDGVEAGDVGFAHEFDGWGPLAGGAAGGPDGDVGFAFGGATEPGGEEIAVFEFDDGGGVSGGEGSFGVDEFLDGGSVSESGGEQQEEACSRGDISQRRRRSRQDTEGRSLGLEA